MNERIKQLAEQAGFNQMGIYNIIGIEEYHQKFAELIVKETVLEVWIQLFNHGIDLSENTFFLEAMKKTKEHFGVKE